MFSQVFRDAHKEHIASLRAMQRYVTASKGSSYALSYPLYQGAQKPAFTSQEGLHIG